MKRYPETLTPQILERTAKISDVEIVTDIADTEREIRDLREVQAAERVIAEKHLDPNERKMADFKASARDGQIAEREAFITYLKSLQTARRLDDFSVLP